MDRRWAGRLRRALLAFYDRRARDLPWRRDRDPYRIWVSEIMLQQTRARAVVPYYERWLQRFPTLDALASASVDDVLRAWAGLGYYRRARNLHQAARLVRERHAGCVPATAAALKALPGVGDYTAGAIASIAYGRREPAVDGNVRRVVSRLLDEPAPDSRRVRSVAAALVPEDRPGDFNQALMELGATVCLPRAPLCDACPISSLCRARRAGTQAQRPAPRRRPPVPVHAFAVGVLATPSRELLFRRRPAGGLLAGLWAFPAVPLAAGSESRAAASSLARALAAFSGDPEPIGTFEHAFTHRRERYDVFLFRDAVPAPSCSADLLPASRPRLDEHAIPAAQRRIARACFDALG